MSTPRLGIIAFARMSSSRLPGKMLHKLGEETLLERVIGRARLLDAPVVLATSERSDDDVLAREAESMGVSVFRGSLEDVMGRAVGAAREFRFDAFARLCGDRPLFPLDDMQRALNRMAGSLADQNPFDLVTSHLPRPTPAGLTTEIIRTDSLEAAWHATTSAEDLEHVTPCFYSNSKRFRILELQTEVRALADLHFSIDSPEDLDAIGVVFEQKGAHDLDPSEAATILRGRLTAR